MLHRILGHVKRQAVAYVALFFALSGGAFAANNYIRSTDTISGGDLDGSTYGSPVIANGKVTNAKLANKSVTVNPGTGLTGGGSVDLGGNTSLGIADGGIDTAQLHDGSVTTGKFSNTIPAARVFDGRFQTIHDVNQPGGGGTPILDWASESYDTAGLHSTSSNTSRLTAPVAGIYRVSAWVYWQPNSSGARQLSFYRNGIGAGGFDELDNAQPGEGGFFATQAISTDIKVAAGDYVEVVAVQSSGGDLNVVPKNFTMSWVAPG